MIALLVSAWAAGASFPDPSSTAAAETARWIVASGRWAYVTSLKDAKPEASVFSYSDGDASSTGHLYFYIMESFKQNEAAWDASITISQEALNSTNSCDAANVDVEDPRCAKITITGKMAMLEGDAERRGKAALFARHPQMKNWPESHGFRAHQLVINRIWMIDFYGGGADITPSKYLAAKPRHNVPSWPPSSPAADVPASVASAVPCSPNCGAAPFEVKSVPGRDSAASSNTARAATPSVSGNYEDPMHPGMKRKVSKSGKFVFVNGADEDGKKFKLDGSVEQHRQTPL